MIESVITFSLKNRIMILVLSVMLLAAGVWSMQHAKIDAIPDLSENQVIVYTEWMGRSPQIIEDQVTFPLVSNLQGLPQVKYVRGSSMFGMSFVYIIFDDDTDVYWARSRVLERLSVVAQQLPEGITPTLGPDGTGVGHILWYTLQAPSLDLGEQRALQDWYIKYALSSTPGVSEIASFGGYEKQYEITLNPNTLNVYQLSVQDVIQSVRTNNAETGGRKFERGGVGYIIKTTGYLQSIEEIESITVKTVNSKPIRIKDIATVQESSSGRLGIFDLNGEGEVVGGIVVMRYGENADQVIRSVKEKMNEVARGFPADVSFNIVYDRSELIQESIASVRTTLLEEMMVVSIVVLIFLFHWRSALSILIQIPITIASSFIFLYVFDISSNIMSLTGIALAIGVIVDNAIIMTENSYKHLSARYESLNSSDPL